VLLVPKPRPSRSKGAGSILSPGARRRLAGWTLRCTLTCQTRRFPTGGGFISRSRISVFSHLHSTQRWPFKGADGCSQSATPATSRLGAARSGVHHSPGQDRKSSLDMPASHRVHYLELWWASNFTSMSTSVDPHSWPSVCRRGTQSARRKQRSQPIFEAMKPRAWPRWHANFSCV